MVKTFPVHGGKSYATNVNQVLSCEFHFTLLNGNIDGGDGECSFSLTILKENGLLLQLPITILETCMHDSPKQCNYGNTFEIILRFPL